MLTRCDICFCLVCDTTCSSTTLFACVRCSFFHVFCQLFLAFGYCSCFHVILFFWSVFLCCFCVFFVHQFGVLLIPPNIRLFSFALLFLPVFIFLSCPGPAKPSSRLFLRLSDRVLTLATIFL